MNKDKCSFEKRKTPPGLPPKRKGKVTDYSIQLREKQKVKRIYGVLEKQFRLYYEKASHAQGITGELLLQTLERRLDNAIYRMGFASSRAQARTYIGHGHVLVNGKRVNIASYLVKLGDVVSFDANLSKSPGFDENIKLAQSMNKAPSWVVPDFTNFKGEVSSLPQREHVDMPIKEQIIVELYSK
ncbi:MAG: 30S ribosomal protein S4 [Leptospiraceae bacterium]|nr:30S ribosomal protein S4 [Leptospiraceae bacterium]